VISTEIWSKRLSQFSTSI